MIVMSDDKSITSLADLLCKLAGERGVTEVRVVDHSVVPKVKARDLRKRDISIPTKFQSNIAQQSKN